MGATHSRIHVMKINLLYIVSHPIQYQAPLLRLLAKSEDMDITTVFYWDRKTEGRFDVGFGQTVKWDVPLLSGYAYFYLSNQGNKISALWKIMSEKQYDIVWTHGYTNFYTALAIFFAKLKKYKVFLIFL